MSDPVPDPTVVVASEADAAGMVEVIHAAFGARPPLDPPSTASAETVASVTAALRRGGGIYASVAGRPAGTILLGPAASAGCAALSRVSVHPDHQRHGIASAMVTAAEDLAAARGFARVELFAREELAELIAFWVHRGFHPDRPAPHGVVLAKALPLAVRVPTADAMRTLGGRLAGVVRPGDLVVLDGELGAGKTTLTQGLGAGLGVRGTVASPTFVLSRVHPAPAGRPALVHVDAYRLGSATELDDLDLDASAPTSVTVVEWGRGLVEGLADDRLELDIVRPPEDDTRLVLLRPVGRRWADVDLAGLAAGLDTPAADAAATNSAATDEAPDPRQATRG